MVNPSLSSPPYPLHTHTHTHTHFIRATYRLVGSIVPQYVLGQVTIIAVRGVDTLESEVIRSEWDVIASVVIPLISCDIETTVVPVCKDQL